MEPAIGLDPGDNAAVETFFKTIKAELIWRHSWQTRQQVTEALFKYINGFYNTRRRHSAIGGISPVNFEQKPPKREQDAELMRGKSIVMTGGGGIPPPFWITPNDRCPFSLNILRYPIDGAHSMERLLTTYFEGHSNLVSNSLYVPVLFRVELRGIGSR